MTLATTRPGRRRAWLAAGMLAATAYSGPAHAQPAWEIAAADSTVGVEGQAMGVTVSLVFEEIGGDIRFDPEAPGDSRLDVRVGITPMQVSGVPTGERDRVRAIATSEAWLAAEAHPEARFTSDRIRATDAGYVAEGTMAMAGAEVPFTLPFTLSLNGDTATARAEKRFDRTRFDIGGGEWDQVVDDTVRLLIELHARRRD